MGYFSIKYLSVWFCVAMCAVMLCSVGCQDSGIRSSEESLDLTRGPSLVLAAEGQSHMRIVLPAGEDTHGENPMTVTLYDAALMLQDYLQRSTSVDVPLLHEPVEPADEGVITLHCGPTTYALRNSFSPSTMSQDEFVIDCADANNIVIIGGSHYGSEFGIYEFLRRYVGVRWLMPGELGEVVPMVDRLVVAMQTIRSKPAFTTRLISTGHGEKYWPQYQWFYRQGMVGYRSRAENAKYEASHYIGIWTNTKNNRENHPEFFPEIDGVRTTPAQSNVVGWQPCYTADGLVDSVAGNMLQYLKREPCPKWLSFGANDCGGECQCAACLAMDDEDRINSVGLPDRSGSYYRFVNDVIAKVSQQYPDVRYGLIAYCTVADPPAEMSFDPRITPAITYDLMQWVDPQRRKVSQNATLAWLRKVPEVAWYDYCYGGWYAVPRMYVHLMADYIRWGYAHGVRRYTSEAYPSLEFKEGPKFYVLFKLLWDPDTDVDAALDEWYRLAVGNAAAPYLRDYFDQWETFWTEVIPTGQWFQDNKTYLRYDDIRYCDMLSVELFDRCRSLMEQVVASAGDGLQGRRARHFYDNFMAMQELMLSRQRFIDMNRPERLTALADRPAELLSVSRFDDGMDDWENWKNSYRTAEFSYSPEVGHDAAGSLKISRQADLVHEVPGSATYLKRFAVIPGRLYRVSFWVRSTDQAKGAKPELIVRWKDADGQWVRFMELERRIDVPLDPPDQWRRVVGYFEAPAAITGPINDMQVHLSIGDSATGQIWFDDFSLEVLGQ